MEKRKVARGIIFFNNQVLLLHRIRKENDKYLEYYAIPGGGIEDLETREEACIREVKEETSLDVNINTYLGLDEYEKGITYYFLTNYLKGEIALGGEEKEHNNPDNFYETKLIDVDELNQIMIYGKGQEMIKKAYDIYKKSSLN